MKHEWVVGFLIDNDNIDNDNYNNNIILIRKNRPEWQAGKLNGVGGKVESGETILEAMSREFSEETGVSFSDWQHFASLTWEEGVVHFFRGFAPMIVLRSCRSITDELIEPHYIHNLLEPWNRDKVIPNLLWLVPLAAYRHDTYDVIDIVEKGETFLKPGRLDLKVS